MLGFGEGMDDGDIVGVSDGIELCLELGKILGFPLDGNDGTILGIAEGERLGKMLVFMTPGNVLGKDNGFPSGEVDGHFDSDDSWMVGAKFGFGRRSIGLNRS
jgi:hypothetical protein